MNLGDLLAQSGLSVRDDREKRLDDGSKAIYLHAGHLHVSREPVHITTILGSCVAVCLFDPVSAVGGMNHYMLPDDMGTNCNTPRHANFAIRTLIERLVGIGAHRMRMQAKVYGGAAVITSFRSMGHHLGQRNVDVAIARLAEAQIRIVDQDTGANHGRKVVFATSTGLALVKDV